MKTISRFLFFIALVSLSLSSCKKDNDGYSLNDVWRSIATVENTENESLFFFTSDNGRRMWTASSLISQYKPKDGQRIIAYYTILSDGPAGGSYQHDVMLRDAYEILTKGIFNITSATQDSIGHDPVKIEEIWIGSDYLNITFTYRGNDQIHFINLVSDASIQYNDGKTHLEFRHNANSDAPTYNFSGIVSFDLTSLKKSGIESLPLVIHVLESEGSDEKTYELNYNFSGSSNAEKSFSLEKTEGEIL